MDREKNGMELSKKLECRKQGRRLSFVQGVKFLVTLCLCFLLISGNEGLVNAQSQSTEKVDFTISSVKDYSTFITRMKNGDDFTGKIVKLTADLDFTGTEFTQVPSFGGTFDGNGHSFSGISGSNGLFMQVTSTGTVKNLTLKDASFAANTNIGAIAFLNYGVIDSCINYAPISIEWWRNAGGIVNGNYGTIINCVNYGSLTKNGNSSNDDGHGMGGIAHTNFINAKIINCYNQGNLVSRFERTSGIIYTNNGQVINCYNAGKAKFGISSNGASNISSCYFLDTVSDTAMPGTYADNNALAMTQSEMSSDSFVTKLNKGAANSDGALNWESGALYPQLVPTYEVTFEKNFSNGTIGSNYSYAAKGTVVTLTAKPADKYYTKSLTVNTEEGIAVDVKVKGNKFTFTMPGDSVVVSASFSTVAKPKSVKYAKSNKTISWGKVADATGYEVYRSTSKTSNFKLLKSVTDLKYADTKATAGTTYYYKVRAYVQVDGVKVYSSLSDVVSSK